MKTAAKNPLRWGLVLIVVLSVLAGGVLAWRSVVEARRPKGIVLEPRPAPDFVLTTQTGEPYRLSDDQGRVRVLFFGYTHCPDVCPATLAVYKQAHARLGDQAEDVRFLFITVDPQRDDPARLADYIARFDPSFYGLTGEPGAVQRVLDSYGVFARALPPDPRTGGYVVEHSTLSYIVDAGGMLRLAHGYGTSPDDIVHDVRLLLREGR